MNRLHAGIRVFSFIDCAVKDSSGHPNQLKFKGVLTMLDEPSSKPPNGSRGHRIIIKKSTAQKLLHTLKDMGINYKDSLDAHNPQHKVGVIQKAWIEGNELWISGIIWKRDFPDAEKALGKKNLGMSFEAADIDVEDTNATVWNLVDFHFTGATILYKNAAAYSKTSASLLASIAASAETINHIYGGAFMKNDKNKKKSAGKTISAADGTLKQVQLLAQGQVALTKSNKKGFAILAEAINNMAKSQRQLTKAILASQENEEEQSDDVEASEDEADGDDDDAEESEISAEGDDEEDDMSGAGKKKSSDDEDDEDDEEEEMDAEGSDDEDEFDNLNDNGEIDEDEVPGSVNKNIVKNKGHKTTTTKMKNGKNVKKPIAASSARLLEQNERLMAQNETLQRRLRKQDRVHAAKLEAAGNQSERRSFASLPKDVTAFLAKGGINIETIAASKEKLSSVEVDSALEAAGVTDIQQRMAIKNTLARTEVIA